MSEPKTLPGTIRTTGTGVSNSILFSFDTHIFTLTSSTTCQPFVTTSATLTYNNETELTGKRNAYGTVGDSVNFTFENGPTAVGVLVNPIVPQSKPDGTGTWS